MSLPTVTIEDRAWSESVSAELLRSCPGVGPVSAAMLLRKYGSYTAILDHCDVLDKTLGPHPSRHTWLRKLEPLRSDAERCMMAFLARTGTSIIPSTDSRYPPLLREISDPPLVLYCLGDCTLLQEIGISIVGTRAMTQYGKEACARITRACVQQGYAIISGMADGIDCEAHQTTLDLGGKTIAVLGTGIESANYFSHIQAMMYERIARHGLVMSEVAPGTPRSRGQFPQRNRIIAGCSRKTIVIEAPERSGALITAWQALDENRDVLAVPGPITHAQSRGCHKLIAAGAEILWDPTRQCAVNSWH